MAKVRRTRTTRQGTVVTTMEAGPRRKGKISDNRGVVFFHLFTQHTAATRPIVLNGREWSHDGRTMRVDGQRIFWWKTPTSTKIEAAPNFKGSPLNREAVHWMTKAQKYIEALETKVVRARTKPVDATPPKAPKVVFDPKWRAIHDFISAFVLHVPVLKPAKFAGHTWEHDGRVMFVDDELAFHWKGDKIVADSASGKKMHTKLVEVFEESQTKRIRKRA